jgi:hypothetical protein
MRRYRRRATRSSDWRGDRLRAAALARSDRAQGGRPPYQAVLVFKVLVPQKLYSLSYDQTEYQIRDRLSFARFFAARARGPGAGRQDGGCTANS